jgi:hypothetical protein
MALVVFILIRIYISNQFDGFGLRLLPIQGPRIFLLVHRWVWIFSELKCDGLNKKLPRKNSRATRSIAEIRRAN